MSNRRKAVATEFRAAAKVSAYSKPYIDPDQTTHEDPQPPSVSLKCRWCDYVTPEQVRENGPAGKPVWRGKKPLTALREHVKKLHVTLFRRLQHELDESARSKMPFDPEKIVRGAYEDDDDVEVDEQGVVDPRPNGATYPMRVRP